MRRMLFGLLLLGYPVMLGGTATAERGLEVNLLNAIPTTVVVSSTVANSKLLPSFIADGDLGTAWNSHTGELVGAWVAVRVPADAQVSSIKLTIGFTRKDNKDDLFTMNPRIKKVRVTRDGTLVVERQLDPEARTLQAIPINTAGGEFKIEVLEIVPGTKPNWREISISELEVWGTVATAGSPKRVKPTVRVRTFDGPTITEEECVKAMFPTGRRGRIGPEKQDEKITATSALGFGADQVVCRVDHAARESSEGTVEIAVVKRAPRLALTVLSRLSFQTKSSEDPQDNQSESSTVEISPLPLTATELALQVDLNEQSEGPGSRSDSQNSTLYRLTAAGLVAVLDWTSSGSEGESGDANRCTLQRGKERKPLPDFALVCVKTEGRWHGEDRRGNGSFESSKTTRYRWNGARYEPK